jgi:hypothetical protein
VVFILLGKCAIIPDYSSFLISVRVIISLSSSGVYSLPFDDTDLAALSTRWGAWSSFLKKNGSKTTENPLYDPEEKDTEKLLKSPGVPIHLER